MAWNLSHIFAWKTILFFQVHEAEPNRKLPQPVTTLRVSLKSPQTQAQAVPLPHSTAEHLLVGVSCDLIPDHHILHQPFGIQPRVIMAYLHGRELPQVLALGENNQVEKMG